MCAARGRLRSSCRDRPRRRTETISETKRPFFALPDPDADTAGNDPRPPIAAPGTNGDFPAVSVRQGTTAPGCDRLAVFLELLPCPSGHAEDRVPLACLGRLAAGLLSL